MESTYNLDAGDGWNGECPDCADRTYARSGEIDG
jgi:hypothetical protein